MMKTNQKAAAIVQMGDNGILDQGENSEDGEKQIDSRCVWR